MTIRARIWLVTMVGATLLLAGLGGVLAAIQPWLAPGAASGGLSIAFAVGALVVLAAFTPIAWLLAGLAYAPVRDVTKTARSIVSTGELDRRCFYPGPHDDVGQLAVVVNDLLVRYDAALGALQRQRAAREGDSCPSQAAPLDPVDLVLDVSPGAGEDDGR